MTIYAIFVLGVFMINILILFSIAVFCFGTLIIANRYFGKDALFVLGIGGAVGANIFNVGNYGIPVGDFLFGTDSIIYTLFVFCTLLCYINYGKKSVIVLTCSVMASIMFTGILQFASSWASAGIETGIVWGLASFAISVIATAVAIFFALWIFKLLKSKNCNLYLNSAVFVIVVSLINSAIYFGGVALFGQINFDLASTLSASYIGKGITLLFALVTMYVIARFPDKKLIEDNENKKNN